MINLFTNKYSVYAILSLAFLAGLWYYGFNRYNAGFNAAELKAQVEMQKLRSDLLAEKEKEITRQLEANRQAKILQDAKIRELEDQNQDLEKRMKENDDAANNEPNRDRIGLDASSVMRIDKIK